MSLFPHGGWIWLSAGGTPSPARGQLLRSFGPALLNNSPLLYNIWPAQCRDAAPLANNGPAQNNNGALLYNKGAPLPCATALLSRAGALLSGITPVLCNGRALQANNCALQDNVGPKLPSTATKERNAALPHEGRAPFPPYFTDAVHSKLESSILCLTPKQ